MVHGKIMLYWLLSFVLLDNHHISFYHGIWWRWVKDGFSDFLVILVIGNFWDARHADSIGDVNRMNACTVGTNKLIVSAFSNFEALVEQHFADGSTAISLINRHAVHV